MIFFCKQLQTVFFLRLMIKRRCSTKWRSQALKIINVCMYVFNFKCRDIQSATHNSFVIFHSQLTLSNIVHSTLSALEHASDQHHHSSISAHQRQIKQQQFKSTTPIQAHICACCEHKYRCTYVCRRLFVVHFTGSPLVVR